MPDTVQVIHSALQQFAETVTERFSLPQAGGEPEVFEFEVSGLKVVKSWLGYRMKAGAGKKSSPLDDIRPERWTEQFTTELLELLWVLEATLEMYPAMDDLLAEIVDGDLFTAGALPPVPAEARKAPKAGPAQVQHGLPI